MSIQDEAAQLMMREFIEAEDHPDVATVNEAFGNVARALADAGLLREDTELNRLRRELEDLKRTIGSLTLSAELLAGDHPIHRGALNGAANEFRELHDTIANILDQEGKQ